MQSAVTDITTSGKSGAKTVPFTEDTYAYFAKFMARKSGGFALNEPDARWTATEFKGEALDEVNKVATKIING